MIDLDREKIDSSRYRIEIRIIEIGARIEEERSIKLERAREIH